MCTWLESISINRRVRSRIHFCLGVGEKSNTNHHILCCQTLIYFIYKGWKGRIVSYKMNYFYIFTTYTKGYNNMVLCSKHNKNFGNLISATSATYELSADVFLSSLSITLSGIKISWKEMSCFGSAPLDNTHMNQPVTLSLCCVVWSGTKGAKYVSLVHIYLVSICWCDAIILGTQVWTRYDEVHVEVGIVVLLKVYEHKWRLPPFFWRIKLLLDLF